MKEEEIKARGREIDGEQWHLPEKFRLDIAKLSLSPEELQKQDPTMFLLWQKTKAEQERLSALMNSAFESPSPQEVERARSVQRAEELHQAVEDLDQQIKKAIVSGDADLEALRTARRSLQHRRAERLAIIGRYDLALEVEPEQAYRERYGKILEAVWRDDDEWCDCLPTVGSGEWSHVTVPTQYVEEDVFSLRHGEVRPLLKCGKCGMMNVSTLPQHLQEQRSHRRKAQALVGNRSPADAAELLKRAGHTTDKLIK